MTTQAPQQWMEGLHGSMAAGLAAQRVLGQRLEAVSDLVSALEGRKDSGRAPVGELLSSIQQATTALRAFRDFSPTTSASGLRRRLKRLARAAEAIVRAEDQLTRLAELSPEDEPARQAANWADRALIRRRARAVASLAAVVERESAEGVRVAVEAHLGGVAALCGDARQGGRRTLLDMARRQLPGLVEALRQAAEGDLADGTCLKALRSAGGRLRLAMELFGPCFADTFRRDYHGLLEDLLAQLDDLEARDRFVARLGRLGRKSKCPDRNLRRGLRSVQEQVGAEAAARRVAFRDRWSRPGAFVFLDRLGELVRLGPGGLTANGATSAGPRPRLRNEIRQPSKVRVAAIDVGTNSIRLVVAESDPRIKFRIIEDVKETTRLGAGLYFTGQLRLESVRRSVRALGRLKAIAQNHHVSRIRAIATSAVREASNGAAFSELVKRRVGLTLETIPAEEEARLAHASVANSFDLEDQRIAVVDIGGGSTEVVFSTHGFVDTIAKLPLGAVHLTEAYSGPDAAGLYRYDAMVKAIDKTIKAGMPEWHNDPDAIIGTGGTFTTLAKISLRRGLFRNEEGRLPFNLRGYKLRHGEVRQLLDWLREMPVGARREVPGVSSRRAEIVVGGLAIVERLMTALHVDRVTVHDGGIRDGLLTQMIDELGYPTSDPRMRSAETVRQVRAFAHQCGYGREHAEHVARLSLQILDQLVAQAPERTGELRQRAHRDVLQAAAVLHEIGQRISFRRFHRHSYDLIVKSHLSIFARRELEIIANVARYHRGSAPSTRHDSYARLSASDQRLVAELAGILRIADGLDRNQMQSVQAVAVHVGPRRVRFAVQSADDPAINLRAAEKKSDVFAAAFGLRPEFTWRQTPQASEGAARPR